MVVALLELASVIVWSTVLLAVTVSYEASS